MVTEFWLLETLEIYLHGKIKIVFLESLNDNKAQALRSGDPTDFSTYDFLRAETNSEIKGNKWKFSKSLLFATLLT